jgi:hypothetical protein
MLTIRLHRRSAEVHAVELRIDGGAPVVRELETRSFLIHDLVHWCVEAELTLDEGFWGLLAKGVPLEVLGDREAPPTRFAMLWRAKSLVGPLQSYLQGRLNRQLLREAIGPAVSDEQLHSIEERFRTALGAWKATPFGSVLRLTWPPSPAVVESNRRSPPH